MWSYACNMSALLRASSKYLSQISSTASASAAATHSTGSLSNLLQTICSPSSAHLSSPKIVPSPSNCNVSAGKNAGSLWILLITWLTRLRCRCTQPPTSRFSGNWFFFNLSWSLRECFLWGSDGRWWQGSFCFEIRGCRWPFWREELLVGGNYAFFGPGFERRW